MLLRSFFYLPQAKAGDEKSFYCDDADGVGVTENLWSKRRGFQLGVGSGPNII
jgi:hypothetical protein